MTAVGEARTAPAVTDPEPIPDEPPGRRRGLVWPALAAVILAAVVGIWLWATNRSTEPTRATSAPVATTTVERGTISATESWDGTLGYGTPFTIRASSGGTITRLADQGATVGRGGELFRVDEQPVVLLSGVVPMYRDLGPGDAGADVAQLETNLAELGYTGFPVDDQYTSVTAAAVGAWQQTTGAEQTGTVARAAVVFAPEMPRLVNTLRAHVGDPVAPGTPILDLASSNQVVSLEADLDDLDRFAIDSQVAVVLPEGDEVTGTVTATTVIEAGQDPVTDDDAAGTEPVVQVEVALDGDAPDQFAGAPIEVVVAVDQRTDVLLVPVTALLALAEGGYGLEVVADDGTTSIFRVDTGLFAGGKVEVDSPDIAEGTVVGVAGR